jgi:hypothetical protein
VRERAGEGRQEGRKKEKEGRKEGEGSELRKGREKCREEQLPDLSLYNRSAEAAILH